MNHLAVNPSQGHRGRSRDGGLKLFLGADHCNLPTPLLGRYRLGCMPLVHGDDETSRNQAVGLLPELDKHTDREELWFAFSVASRTKKGHQPPLCLVLFLHTPSK